MTRVLRLHSQTTVIVTADDVEHRAAIYCQFTMIFTGLGQSMCLLSCNVIIQQRFSKHRSLATGISIMGWSFGNIVGAPLTELLFNSYGLRGTLALLGAIQAHRIPLALQFRSPQQFRADCVYTQVD